MNRNFSKVGTGTAKNSCGSTPLVETEEVHLLNYVQSSLGDGEVAALGTTMTRLTAKALMYLVLAPTTHQLPSHTPLRRAGIDLIGLKHRVEESQAFFLLS
jgi:hypothetical protein